jgi:hypothetical protein
MNYDQGFELPYMAQDQRIADEYLSADILSWYTDSPVEYWVDMLSNLTDFELNLYVNWAKGMEDSFPTLSIN